MRHKLEPQCRTSDFSSINEAFAVVQKYLTGTALFFSLYPFRTELTILSTSQRTACVARICRHPFRRLNTPTDEYGETSTARSVLMAVEARPVPIADWWKCANSAVDHQVMYHRLQTNNNPD